MKQKNNLLKNTIIIGIGKFSSQVIMFLMLPLYTSFLNTSEYGIYDTLVAIATFVTPFITILLEESMFRFLIEYNEERERKKVITITVKFHVLGIIIFSMIYLIICIFYNFQYKTYFWLYVVINVIHGLSNALSRGLGNIKLYSFSNFITNIIIVILNVLTIAILKYGVYGLFISFIIAHLISSFIVFIKINLKQYINLKNSDKIMAKKMIKYSIPLVPNSLSWSIINLSDRVMLTYMVSSSANGIYSVANKFPQIMGSIYNFFSTAWKESASKSIGNQEYYNEIYKNITKVLYIITIGLLIILPICYRLFVAEDFMESYYYVPVLIIAMMFSNISEFYSGIFIAYKNTKIIGITTVISAIVNVVINIISMNKLGIWAASFSTLISTLLIVLFRRKKLNKYVKLNEDYKEIFKYIFLIIITVISFYIRLLIYNILFLIVMLIILYLDNRNYLKHLFKLMKEKHEK